MNEKMKHISVGIADIFFKLTLNFSGTIEYFSNFKVDDSSADCFELIPSVDYNILFEEIRRLHCDPFFAEYSILIESLTNRILSFKRFFFHGAAFLLKGQAYVLTGKSGVGKSTMLKNLMTLYPEEIEVINGDKPVIEYRDDSFIVHPSPWNGKENWKGNGTGILAGMICLEQGPDNKICRLKKQEAVFPVFLQFLFKPEDIESVDHICRYEEALLENVHVFRFINNGSLEAAEIMYKTLIEKRCE